MCKAVLACAVTALGAALIAPTGHAAGTWPQTELAYCGSPFAGGAQAVALSEDGRTALVGVSLLDATSHALAYSWNGTSWGQATELVPPGGVESDGINYAHALGLSGDGSTAVVSDYGRGELYAFTRAAGVWKLQGTISSSLGPYWGYHVSISADGNTVVATALPVSTRNPGYAAVVMRQGGAWGHAVPLVTNANVWSAAVSGDGAAVLVGYNDSAHLFRRRGTTWTDSATLTGDPSKPGFGVGTALDQTGQVALITASNVVNTAGQGYIFDEGPSGWSQAATLTPSDLTTYAGYGLEAVALSSQGGVALIGARQQANSDGAVYVWSGRGTSWTLTTKLTEPGAYSSQDSYGGAVAISGDGATGLIGSTTAAVAAGARAGAAAQCPETGGSGGGAIGAPTRQATAAPSAPSPAAPSSAPTPTVTPMPTETPAAQVTPDLARAAKPPSGPSILLLLPLALAMGGGAYVGGRRWRQWRRHLSP